MHPFIKRVPFVFLFYFVFFLQNIASAAPFKPSPAADTTITGQITDSAGAALAGVSVTIKGTSIGTVTVPSGAFILYNVPARATLVISAVGYQTREIRLTAGQTYLSLNLSAEAGTLTDVIITGFQRIEKSKFTGASVKLDMDKIKTEGITDVSRMLEGRAAGVAIQNVSGTFGFRTQGAHSWGHLHNGRQ